MAYKYTEAMTNIYNYTTGCGILSEYQAFINEQFYNAPDSFAIQEEYPFASGFYVEVDVRVNRGINTYTGEKLGDDFKNLIFRDLQHATSIGTKYFFNNNYWVVINSEIIKNFAASCTIRRCNNRLRWVNENGVYYEEPCSIEYKISRPRDEVGSYNPVTPQGYIEVFSQLNDKTKKIKGNQRFLFGSVQNRVAFKVFGDGVRSYLNQETLDDESAALLSLSMGGNFVNTETDDITLGIADYNKIVYAITISPSAINGSTADSIQLNSILTFNSTAVTRPLSYVSSNSSVATTSGSGLITLVSAGSCITTVSMTSNSSVSGSLLINVSASALTDYQVRITPNVDYILEGDTTDYDVYLYTSGSVQGNSFTMTLANGNVPTDHYVLTITDGNNFSIENKEFFLDYPLVINCTSGSFTKQLNVQMLGAW